MSDAVLVSNPGLRCVQDASLQVQGALPTASSAAPVAAQSASIDCGALHGISAHYEGLDIVLQVPALSAAELPNGASIEYAILGGSEPLVTLAPTTLATLTQTAPTAGGSITAQVRAKLPATGVEYVAAVATAGTGAATVGSTAPKLLLALTF